MDSANATGPTTLGTIATFYSYKGGVGRSMALANIGVLLARAGKRVLLVDWDLEAPGLERYFAGFPPTAPTIPGGLLGLLYAARKSSETDWRPYASPLHVPGTPPILFLGSGHGEADYAQRLANFSWQTFFNPEKGGEFLERLRNVWQAEFDFVLLDSRTGITDAGGVCTILMPDVLVLVFSANAANVEGARKVADAALAARERLPYDRTRLRVFPLPSRFDGREEVEEGERWLDRFAETFAPFYADWLPTRIQPREVLELTKIPYVAFFSFGEKLPVVTHSLTDTDKPGHALNLASRLLLGGFANAEAILDPPTPTAAASAPTLPDMANLLSRLREDATYPYQLVREAEQEFPGETPALAKRLNELARLFYNAARFAEAEPLYRRALSIDEKTYGPGHPMVAFNLDNLADLLWTTNRLAEAEPILRRALDITEKSLRPEHPMVATRLNNLAELLRATNRPAEAEPMLRRALAITEKSLGPEHPEVAAALNNLAGLLRDTNRPAEAELMYRRMILILLRFKQATGHQHPNFRAGCINYRSAVLKLHPEPDKAVAWLREQLGPDAKEVLKKTGFG